ncbi:MAG: hypothetical protein ACLP5H_04855 [Desulfomonilaceae bacterium]
MKRPYLPPAPDPRRSGLFIRLLQRQKNGRRRVVRGWIGGKAYHFVDKSKLVVFLCITLSVALTTEAHAYLDPGIGTYTFQILIAGVMVGVYTLGRWRNRLLGFFSKRFADSDGKSISDQGETTEVSNMSGFDSDGKREPRV